jgi:hypothetical protein
MPRLRNAPPPASEADRPNVAFGSGADIQAASALGRLPSEYMRDMFYTSQPLEKTNQTLLQATMEAFNADTQLLYASDWPHWDFDPPSAITTLPFLSEQAKRNILGLNAARIFNLEVKRKRPKAKDVLASRPGFS